MSLSVGHIKTAIIYTFFVVWDGNSSEWGPFRTKLMSQKKQLKPTYPNSPPPHGILRMWVLGPNLKSMWPLEAWANKSLSVDGNSNEWGPFRTKIINQKEQVKPTPITPHGILRFWILGPTLKSMWDLNRYTTESIGQQFFVSRITRMVIAASEDHLEQN